MFPDWTLILNQIIALGVVLAPLEVFVLANLIRFRVLVTSWLAAWTSPETRKGLFGEIAHGVLRAVYERAGSMQGVAAKSQKAGLIEMALGGGGGSAAGALAAIPGKVDLPIVGKVTIGEALQLFNTLKGLLAGGGFGALTSTAQTGGSPRLP